MTDFFVMLYTRHGSLTPMLDDDNEIAKFHTAKEAAEAAKKSIWGDMFGYEVFEIGTGD